MNIATIHLFYTTTQPGLCLSLSQDHTWSKSTEIKSKSGENETKSQKGSKMNTTTNIVNGKTKESDRRDFNIMMTLGMIQNWPTKLKHEMMASIGLDK